MTMNKFILPIMSFLIILLSAESQGSNHDVISRTMTVNRPLYKFQIFCDRYVAFIMGIIDECREKFNEMDDEEIIEAQTILQRELFNAASLTQQEFQMAEKESLRIIKELGLDGAQDDIHDRVLQEFKCQYGQTADDIDNRFDALSARLKAPIIR